MPEEPDFRPERGPESQDDVLDLGRRRRLPRWTIMIGWAAVTALVVTVVVARAGSSDHGARPSPANSGPVLTEPLGGPVSADLAIEGRYLFEFSQGALYRTDIGAGGSLTADGVLAVTGLDLTLESATFHLVADASTHRIWMLTYGAAPATVVEFDAQSLTEVGRLLWPSEVHAAAAFGGHLYLAATNAVVDIASAKGAPTTIGALTGQYSSIVADTARSRLLLFGEDHGPRVSSYTPAGGRSARGPAAPFGKGGLLVVGSSIWAAGYGDTGAVLARLDPGTLRPVAFSELSPQLGPGAIAVAAGAHVLWVRAGGIGDDALWCVSATTGDQLQYWQYAGAVASTRGAGFVAQRDGPLSLQLSGCPG